MINYKAMIGYHQYWIDHYNQQENEQVERSKLEQECKILAALAKTSFKGSYFKNSKNDVRCLVLSKDTNPIIYSREVVSTLTVGAPSASVITELVALLGDER